MRLACIAALFLAGCAVEPVALTTPFSPTDHSAWEGRGTATLRGQAFLRTVGGEVRTCAGSTVLLMPASVYGREFVTLAAKGTPIANPDPRYRGTWRTTVCGADGSFTFRDLPAADWIAETDVIWVVPMRSYNSQQGGFLRSAITTLPGETTEVILTAR